MHDFHTFTTAQVPALYITPLIGASLHRRASTWLAVTTQVSSRTATFQNSSTPIHRTPFCLRHSLTHGIKTVASVSDSVHTSGAV
jgi:hypothetical protein